MATAQQTAAQARALIDPLLTSVARGYLSPLNPVAEVLFPRVPVTQRGGSILAFSADDYKLVNSRRAFGANTLRIQYGYARENFALVDYRLEGSVPNELQQEAAASQGPSIDLLEGAVQTVRDTQAREREYQAATLATTAASYPAANKATLAGADQWNDPLSDPFTDIMEAKEVIRLSVGRPPNVLVLAPAVATALRSHPKVLDRLSTATDRPPATLTQLAALFELERVIVADSTYYTGTAFVDMWGKFAVLAYTIPGSAASKGTPNFGYTYQLVGYPVAEEAYLDRNPNTWAQPVADARQVVLVGPSAGFLFSAAVA